MTNKNPDAPGKRRLEDALLQAIMQQPYSQITVARLIALAGVTRKTFYLYFANRESCLRSLIHRTIQDTMLAASRRTQTAAYLWEYYQVHFEIWLENRNFLSALVKNDLSAAFLQEFMGYIRQDEREFLKQLCAPIRDDDEDCLIFYVSGYVALLLNWCYRGFDTPASEMAQKFERLLHFPLISTE